MFMEFSKRSVRRAFWSVAAAGFALMLPASVLAQAPANDNFANATALYGTSPTVAGANTNIIGLVTTSATKEVGEPNHDGNAGGGSVWYQWVSPSTSTNTLLSFTANFNALVAVYQGTGVNALSVVASNMGTTLTLPFSTVRGSNYYFAVDGTNSGLTNELGGFNLGLTTDQDTNAGHFEFATVTNFASERQSQSVLLMVRRVGGFKGQMDVDVSTFDGTGSNNVDYIGTSQTLQFDHFQMSATMNVSPLANSLSLNDRNFLLSITNARPTTNAVSGITEDQSLTPTFSSTPTVVVVRNVDNPAFSNATRGIVYLANTHRQVTEGNGTIGITVVRQGGDLTVAASVEYRLSSLITPCRTPIRIPTRRLFRLLTLSYMAVPSGRRPLPWIHPRQILTYRYSTTPRENSTRTSLSS